MDGLGNFLNDEGIGSQSAGIEEPQEPQRDEPQVDEPQRDEPQEGEPQTGEGQSREGQPSEGQGSEEPSTPQESKDEPLDLKSELDALRAQVNLLLKLQKGESIKQPEEGQGQGRDETQVPKVELDLDFSDVSVDDFLENPQAFGDWARKFASTIADRTLETVYRNLPDLVRRYSEEVMTVKSYASQFYKQNPDLEPYKTEVARIANMIAQAEPGLSYEEFFKKVADYARYSLGLFKKAQRDVGKSSKPALPKTPAGGRRKPETIEGMEREILDLINSL